VAAFADKLFGPPTPSSTFSLGEWAGNGLLIKQKGHNACNLINRHAASFS